MPVGLLRQQIAQDDFGDMLHQRVGADGAQRQAARQPLGDADDVGVSNRERVKKTTGDPRRR